jgi:hypothetical protein
MSEVKRLNDPSLIFSCMFWQTTARAFALQNSTNFLEYGYPSTLVSGGSFFHSDSNSSTNSSTRVSSFLQQYLILLMDQKFRKRMNFIRQRGRRLTVRTSERRRWRRWKGASSSPLSNCKAQWEGAPFSRGKEWCAVS